MKSYRTAFTAALAANIALLGAAAGLWWHTRAAMRVSNAGQAAGVAPAAAPAAAAAPRAAATHDPDESPLAPLAPLAPLQISPQRLQSIGVRSGEVLRKVVADRIVTTGNVAVDETRRAYIQVRFSGYIQKVFVDATYRYVRKGQPLFTIYSPELVSTEREYLVARENQRALERSSNPEVAADAASLVDAAAQRLEQWEIPQREIARLESSGQVQQNLEIDAPASGYVTEREALPNKYVQPDTRLYTLADLSTIWVFAQVFQNDLGRVKVGDAATLTVDTYAGRGFSGRVDFIYPDIDLTTRTARVRLTFANPALRLMPGMFVNVALEIPMGERTVIPASGVLQSGTRQIVFVDHGGGELEPRDVQLGARAGENFIVLKGLEPGEKIITSANFLIDSESQLQAALQAFAAPPTEAGAAAATAGSKASVVLVTEPDPPRKGSNLIRIKLIDADGAPVSGAQVTVTFLMPAMPAMGMAAMRVPVTLGEQGDGVYQGHVQLASGGTWQVAILASKNQRTIASRQLSVSAQGGM